MPKFLNTNSHLVYVDNPDDEARDLTRIYTGEVVDAEGRFADNLSQTPGVVPANSEEAKGWRKGEKDESGEVRYPVDAPEVLAVGPDLEPVHRSEADQAAERYGQKVAVAHGDLGGLSKDELQKLADEKGVEYAKRDTKADLIDKIEAGPQTPSGGGTIVSGGVPSK